MCESSWSDLASNDAIAPAFALNVEFALVAELSLLRGRINAVGTENHNTRVI